MNWPGCINFRKWINGIVPFNGFHRQTFIMRMFVVYAFLSSAFQNRDYL